MIILAIDVGTVRVGCAASDTTVGIPFPVAVWPRAQARAEKALLATIAERRAELLVVGLPLGPNGERTAICENIEGFVTRLAKRTPVTIVYIDEAFSSDEATQRLRAASASPEEIDAYAACLILERYLQANPPQAPTK
jgi:putative Holliday junction resolvase